MTWTPSTLEDHLRDLYRRDHTGALYLEVPVGGGDPTHGPRRIDGVLLPDREPAVHPQHSYGMKKIRAAADGAITHLLEAKRTLNRNVIGHVVAGRPLLEEALGVSDLVGVAVCGDNNTVLASVCTGLGIEVALYPEAEDPPEHRELLRMDLQRAAGGISRGHVEAVPHARHLAGRRTQTSRSCFH